MIKNICSLLLITAAISACSKLEDTFGDFADDRETIYVGAPDTLIAQSGYEKLRLFAVINADPKILKGEIRIGNDTIPQKFDIERRRAGSDTVFVDLSMPEGSYRISVTLLDNVGNKSLVKSLITNIFGPSYVRTLGTKTIASAGFVKSADPIKTGALLNFGNSYEGLAKVRLKYNNSKGVPVVKEVDRFAPSVILNDFEAGGEVIAESIYFPKNPFYEFKATGIAKGKLPACNQLSVAKVTNTVVQFPDVESEKSSIKSFGVSWKGCVMGSVTLSASAPFTLATSENGTFGNTISLDSIGNSRMVYVAFKPVSSRDSLYSGKVSIEAANILNAPIAALSGKEKEVKK